MEGVSDDDDDYDVEEDMESEEEQARISPPGYRAKARWAPLQGAPIKRAVNYIMQFNLSRNYK